MQEEEQKVQEILSIEMLAKKTVKDSVFRDLFSNPKYLFMLYQALHPEDKEATEADLGMVTIKNILLNQTYNDLGFMIGDKLLVLAEAQSTWTVNIVIRNLMYLVQTWQEYIQSTGQNVYASKAIQLPKPELYVIYTKKRRRQKKYISLTEEFFKGQKLAVNVNVQVLYLGEEGNIINQYIKFTQIYNQQVKKHGRTRKAVLETIHICENQDILKEYLEERKKEVVNIMMALFDEEYILKTYIEDEKRKAAKEIAKKTALELSDMGLEVEKIARAVGVSKDIVEKWIQEKK